MPAETEPFRTDTAPSAAVLDAVIIGAGFSGLYLLHQLRDQLGLSVRVLEAGAGVGGTWYWNRYPGARCDSESYSYCYSFDPDLMQEWNWSQRYPEAAEIRQYLDHVADRFDLRRSIISTTASPRRPSTSAPTSGPSAPRRAAATWHASSSPRSGACPPPTSPTFPASIASAVNGTIPGVGRIEGVDFTGKRVGLIGTGSTGIQATPPIAEQSAHLTVFQRTANYSVPARNAPFTAEAQAKVKANYQAIREKMRSNINGHPYDIRKESALEVSEQERQRRYEAAWEKGGLEFRAAFGDLLTNKQSNDTASDFIRAKIRSIVKDPETVRVLTPTDHPFASKRPPIDTNYFETFNRDNVALVDVRAAPIEEITPRGIKTSAREYELDVIVFATGFDAMTGPMLAMDITGTEGRSLRQDWAAGPRTYLGVQVPGYPNMFTVTGPGSPSVLANMPVAIEQHTQWIARCIGHMRQHGLTRIEADAKAAEDWGAHVNDAASQTLLPMANHSWYLGANVPGKPRVFMPYAGGMARYAKFADEVAQNNYRGFHAR